MQEKQTELRGFHGDAKYYEDHRDDLLQRYPEQWVAILSEEVVGAAEDYQGLLDQVEKQGASLGQVFIERATSKEEVLILPQ